jgi:hypothetical protein
MTATTRRLLVGLTAGLALLTAAETASAQEILLTGPLAGAPAVRKLRLYRQGRFQLTPSATFTLLDRYQRAILPGLQLDYNLTDWLSIGVYGGYAGDPIDSHIDLALTKEVQDVNANRRCRNNPTNTDCRLTSVNMSGEFPDQLGQIDWIASPQLTGVPFRGKLALFKSIYVDTEIFFFAGVGLVGLQEREECEKGHCAAGGAEIERTARMAIAPTGGLGFSFFVNKFMGLHLGWRILPFAWNQGGFDTAGGDPDGEFPDGAIDEKDRQYRFNMLTTVGWTVFLPTKYRVSE